MKKVSILLTASLAATFSAQAAAQVDFVKEIQPILERRCISCHGPEKQKGKLRLDSRDAALKEAVVPNKASESELYKRVTLPPDDVDIMPPKGETLTKEATTKIRDWIDQGAKWPEGLVLKSVDPDASPAEASVAAASGKVDFSTQIWPILQDRCVSCHGPEKQKGKLRLDSKEEVAKHEEVLVAGAADQSELFARISLPPDDVDIMPAKGEPLTKEQIELIKKWINEGAEWPEQVEAADAKEGGDFFTAQIKPILLNRCVECHGSEKQKGDLRLDTKEGAFHEDHTIVAGAPGESELFRRVSLPADDVDIMPAKGDPLTAEQISLIKQWIEDGANWPSGVAVQETKSKPTPVLALEPIEPTAVEKEAVAKLEELGVPIRPIAMNVNWKELNFRFEEDAAIQQALPLLKNVLTLVELNFAGTDISDSALRNISGLSNLTHLHLERTKVTDDGLRHLQNLKNLTYLNLYGTQVTDAGLEYLKGLQNLRNLYLWQTKATESGVQKLQAALPSAEINTGWELQAADSAEDAEDGKKADEE